MKQQALILATLCLTLLGCGRSTNQNPAPIHTAYSDGFEVLVIETDNNGIILSAQSLTLTEAEAAVTDAPNLSFTIQDADRAVELLTANESRQGDFSTLVEVTPSEAGQIIRTSFHSGNRTFWYEYQATSDHVTPLNSGTRDLKQNAAVQYVGDAE